MKLTSLFFLLLFAKSIAQCPENIYGFNSQAEVDNFVNLYPNCENAYVFVFAGADILDLAPLTYINNISHIQINDADNIKSLLPFDEMDEILSLYIRDSDGLTSLDGIHFTNTFPQFAEVSLRNNSVLENIDALDDTDTTFDYIRIIDNPNLSECSVSRICETLSLGEATILIENNEAGCNSQEEVEIGCGIVGLSDFELTNDIFLYPNPAMEKIELSTELGINVEQVNIHTVSGKQLLVTSETAIDISSLSDGIYFLVITTNQGTVTKKMFKR